MLRPLLIALAGLTVCAPAFAEETPSLSLELNALQPAKGSCRVTFLVTNGLAAPIDKATVEVAFFGAGGGIDRLVSLDFKALAKGKTKVVQFALSGLDCAAVSRVLVNDVTACDGDGLDAAGCAAALTTSSRVDAAFGV